MVSPGLLVSGCALESDRECRALQVDGFYKDVLRGLGILKGSFVIVLLGRGRARGFDGELESNTRTRNKCKRGLDCDDVKHDLSAFADLLACSSYSLSMDEVGGMYECPLHADETCLPM